MSPTESFLLRLRGEIEAELEALQSLIGELTRVPAGSNTPDSYILRAKASIMHDFYTGVERIFIRIAQQLGGGIPSTEQWHRDLLLDMTLDLDPVRPPVIGKPLHDGLIPFLRFRHLFRNLYGYILDPEKLHPLETALPQVLSQLQQEMRAFLDWMSPRSKPS
jgi:hypothetical protein